MNPATSSHRDPPIRILVVDDHLGTATTLARALAQLRPGLEVIPATSGQEALERVKHAAADILITDMIMPEMSGLQLIEKLQNHPAGRPTFCFLITAYDVPGLWLTARRLNVSEIFTKPVNPERICQVIIETIQKISKAKPTSNELVSQSRFTVLIADDQPDNIMLLTRYLEGEGYNYLKAKDGLEALEKIRGEMPDLVLLDVNMPNKDGFTVLEEIRADPAIQHIPVIILTATRLDSIQVQFGLNLGADDYITKPFDRRELMARIRTKLRVKEAEDVIRRRNRELSVLPEIGKELSARLDINELIDVVLHQTVETLGALLGHVVLFEPKGPVHKKYYVSKLDSTIQEIRFPPLNDLVAQIKVTRQGLIIDDTQTDPRWQPVSDQSAMSVIIVPMFGHFELIGLLILAHEQKGYFKLDHILLSQAIASQASIAVENAQLYKHIVQEQSRLSAVLQGAADAIMMFDEDGCLSMLNPTAEKLFTDYQTKLGLPLARNCGYDRLIACLDDVLASGKSRSEEILWPDQRVFTASFTCVDRGGCVVLLHDVSHFKALEKVKDEFIATASHDLKNPIMAINGFSQLLQVAGPLNAQQQEFAQRIALAAENMRELVENMLDLAKLDTGMELKHETVELKQLLAEIAQEFEPQAKAKGQVLTLNTSENEVQVYGDPFQLKQALRNLVGNALKYTPTDGTVSLALDLDQYTAWVDVKDNGFGIPAQDLPHIFERFYRVREGAVEEIKGNGLGLAIVRSILEKHGGQVGVESELGKGSCFTVTLPLQMVADHPQQTLTSEEQVLPPS